MKRLEALETVLTGKQANDRQTDSFRTAESPLPRTFRRNATDCAMMVADSLLDKL